MTEKALSHGKFIQRIPLTKKGRSRISDDLIILRDLVTNAQIHTGDVVVDIGCGEGALILQLLKRRFRGEIFGITDDAERAEKLDYKVRKHADVSIICGTPAEAFPPSATIVYFCGTDDPEEGVRCAALIEQKCRHPVKLIYGNSRYADSILKRPGWRLFYHDYHYILLNGGEEIKMPCAVLEYSANASENSRKEINITEK